MFQNNNQTLTEQIEGINRELTYADISLQNFIKTFKTALSPREVFNAAARIHQMTRQMTKEVMGLSVEATRQIETVLAESARLTLDFGVGVGENIELVKDINSEILRTTLLTETQLQKFAAFRFTTNMATKDIAQMVESFDMLGRGVDDTLDYMQDITQEARRYGLNVNAFMGNMRDNIAVLATFNFEEGVNGLTKMVAKAQALRIDVGKTFDIAEQLLDPDKAIEMAANFQMLGGEIGALGDPFRLLYMAQSDVDGLQESIVDLAASAVIFNEKTGEFDIPVGQMYRLRSAAESVGMGYREMTQMAIKSAQRTRKLDILKGFTGLDDNERELLANVAKFDGGELKITTESGDVQTIEEYLRDGFNVKTLQKQLTEANKSELTVAIESRNLLEKIYFQTLKAGQITTTRLLTEEGEFEKVVENLSGGMKRLNQHLQDTSETIDFTVFTNTLTSFTDKVGSIIGVLDKFAGYLPAIIKEAQDIIYDLSPEYKDYEKNEEPEDKTPDKPKEKEPLEIDVTGSLDKNTLNSIQKFTLTPIDTTESINKLDNNIQNLADNITQPKSISLDKNTLNSIQKSTLIPIDTTESINKLNNNIQNLADNITQPKSIDVKMQHDGNIALNLENITFLNRLIGDELKRMFRNPEIQQQIRNSIMENNTIGGSNTAGIT